VDIESIKNFLDKDSFKDIEEIFFSYPNYFPWYLGPGKSFEGDGHLQFVHLFFSNNKINSPDFTSHSYQNSQTSASASKMSFNSQIKTDYHILPSFQIKSDIFHPT